MLDIPVYKAEIDLGLSDIIRASKTISYINPINKIVKKEGDDLEHFRSKVKAHESNQIDLYDIYDILVSTVWNLNDDIFTAVEAWKARHTPVNKPFNFEHNTNDIIGHTVNVWAVDDNMETIPDDTPSDSLPAKYHLMEDSVMYLYWDDDTKRARANEIVKEIGAGEWYVSMEALVPDFDYGLMNGDELKIVARNSETAFLSQYLRAYKGAGEYQGSKIGRVLKNFIFCGKGLVKKPANPESIIFKEKASFKVFSGYSLIKSSEMENEMSTDNKDALIEKLEKEVSELKSRTTKESLDKLNKTISGLEDSLKAKEAECQSAADSLEAAKAENKSLQDELAKSKTELEAVSKSLAETNTKLEEIKKEADKQERLNFVASTLQCDAEESQSYIQKLEKLDTADFKEFIKDLASKLKPKENKKTETEKAKEGEKALESVETPQEPDAVTASQKEDVQSELAKAVAAYLKQENK